MKFKIIAIFILILFSVNNIFSQKEVGTWKTIDDETGNPETYVELYIQNDRLYGKIIKILDENQKNAICSVCEGNLKNKPILGMQIINGLQKRKNDWYLDKGVLFPKNGKFFDCKIWLENDNTLKVRGYWGLAYRTQTWYRVK